MRNISKILTIVVIGFAFAGLTNAVEPETFKIGMKATDILSMNVANLRDQSCGGCAIFPDGIIVADDDGAVAISADFVANKGAEHELPESWLVQEVERGAKLPGLYPPNEENKKRYEDWKKTH